MTAEKKERMVYRLCPCFSHDIGGIQTWLEDLALEGLFLEPDGRILSVFTFRRGTPRKALYRLEAWESRGSVSAADGPDWDIKETFSQMGWQYLVNFGSFHIYRSFDPNVRELNTDPAVQSLTLNTLKKNQRSTAILTVVNVLLLLFMSSSPGVYLWRLAVTAGPFLPLSIIGVFLWAFVSSLLATIRLHRYQKRLRRGESLTARSPWKPTAHLAKCARLLPCVLVLAAIVSLCSFGLKASGKQPVEECREPMPFATLEEIFPDGRFDRTGIFDDYNTFVSYDTLLAANCQWNEFSYITQADGTYYCLVRLEYHETLAPWLARLTARDHYRYEQRRYSGKRFEDAAAPETEFDTIYIFRSYGILHIVVQEGSTAAHATIHMEDPNREPCWELWLEAMEEKLCR